MEQADLFDTASKFPPGLRCVGELISHAVEKDLVNHLQELEFKPFEFHGFLGKRRIVSFGWRYDFGGGGLQKRRPRKTNHIGLEPGTFGAKAIHTAKSALPVR